MAVSAQVSRSLAVHGSAVIIAPGVAVTAKHVLDEIASIPSLTGVIGIVPRDDGSITFWHATTYHPIARHDIVIMAIKPMSAEDAIRRVQRPVVHARVPNVGERVTVLGFREVTTHSGSAPQDLVLIESTGPITEVYRQGRDRVLLPNPCLEVDISVVGGMSGGPAFDEAGRLIGVVSTSVSGGDGRPTYVSLIWPNIVWPFKPVWPDKLYPETTTLKELALGLPPGVVNERAQHLPPAKMADVIDAELVHRLGEPGEEVEFLLATRSTQTES